MSFSMSVNRLLSMQMTTEVMQLFSDEDEVEKAFSGENVKIKLKNVEEEVSCKWLQFVLLPQVRDVCYSWHMYCALFFLNLR